jgi:radical SAM protein with 4Fe4S-binding SPASM domain
MKIFNFTDILPETYNLLARRRFNFQFELIPYSAKELSYKKMANFFLAGMNQFFLPSKPFGHPVIAQIEPTNFCNLSCPLCLTTSETVSRPREILPFETFTRFIDETGDYLLLIVMWNWGEPFLNPRIFDMIRYAKDKNIVVHTSTNGNVKFNDEKAEMLIDSGLDSIVFAVDGACQETYSTYRKGGNLESVISSIKAIVSAKERKKSRTPRMIMRTVVMKHNEMEINTLRDLARELKFDFFTLKTVDLPPDRGSSLDIKYAPDNMKYQRYEYEAGKSKRKQKPFQCMRPWKRITLDAMGEIIPCEMDYKSSLSYGNVKNSASSVAVWKNEQSRKYRAAFNNGNNDSYICRDCNYKHMIADDCIVEKMSLK